jgi:hypothetical protein
MGQSTTAVTASPTAACPVKTSLSLRRILRTWWPLSGSWLLMTAELPLISAVIARLDHAEINLAAWGVVYALSIIIQSPSTMLLAASTALSKDVSSYRKLHRFMLGIGLLLTGLHTLIAFTPLFDVVVGKLMGLPAELLGATRLGLMIMTPWSWGTAFRRMQQGVLIRFDQSQAVIWGSLIRLGMDSLMLTVGYLLGGLPGIALGATAIICGVISEALYTGLRVQPVLRGPLKRAPTVTPVLTFWPFMDFYVPLAATILMMLLIQPMVSAALSRMPHPLESLAVWPVLFGLLTMWQSVGIGYNEAVIALLDEPGSLVSLRRFTKGLVVLMTGLLLIMTAMPLSAFWFGSVAALPPALVTRPADPAKLVSGRSHLCPPHPQHHRVDGGPAAYGRRYPVERRGLGRGQGCLCRPACLYLGHGRPGGLVALAQPPGDG